MTTTYKNRRLRMISVSKSIIKVKLEFRYDFYQMKNLKIPNSNTRKNK